MSWSVVVGTTYAKPSYGRKADERTERLFADKPSAMRFLEYSVEVGGYSWGWLEESDKIEVLPLWKT